MSELDKFKKMRGTLEHLRETKYPNIPSELVDKVLESLSLHGENAYSEIRNLLVEHFNKIDHVQA